MGVRVREVHGSWYVFINHQGKRKAKKTGPGPDGKRVADEAARLIAARLSLGDLGVLQEPEPRETFAAFAEAWLDGYARSLKRRTQENYRQVLRAHWIPTLGNLELADIGREEIRVVVTQQMRHGLQISTIRTNLDVLHACLTAAVDEGKIPTNPATRYGRSILRLLPIRRRHIRVFWPDEMDLLLRRAQARHPTNSYLVILLMSRTGLRGGEALTLQVDDLDLENRDLWVRRTWGTRYAGRWQDKINSPKRGERRADMSQHLCRELRDNLQRYPRRTEWLFPTKAGVPMTYLNFRQRYWMPLFDQTLPFRTPHVLRHTLATWLLQNGEPMTYVKDQLGHSSIKITVDVYGHLMPGSNKLALDRLENLQTRRNHAPRNRP